MTQLLFILLNVSLPILLLIASGYIFQKIFKTDVRSFTKLLIYVLTPVVIFVKILDVEFTGELFLLVGVFALLMQAAMYLISIVYCRLLRYTKSKTNAAINALILFNTGNYGIPLIDLAFSGSPLAATSQIFIIIMQNITTNTLGVYLAGSGSGNAKNALKSIVKMPVIYIMIAGVIVNLLHVQIPKTIMIPLDYMADGFFAMALIGIGIQLAEVPFEKGGFKKVLGISLLKLISAPVLGFLFVLLLGIKGMLAQALIIGISTPTAINSALLATEFNNEPAFAAQIVVVTTVLCTLTLPPIIYLAGQYFV